MRISLHLLLFLFISSAASAQPYQQFNSRNTIYVGGSTRGAYYSVNYDRIFHVSDQRKWTYRAGISVLPDQLAIPLGINLLLGQGPSHLEANLVVMPFILDRKVPGPGGDDQYDKMLHIFPGIGYRYQQSAGGLFFNLIASPYLTIDISREDIRDLDPHIYPALSAGLGLSF